MPNLDFTYIPEPQPDHSPTTKVVLGASVNLAEDAMACARLCYQIKQRPVAEWKEAIQAAPETLRERLRGLLVREWEEARERHRTAQARSDREQAGKASPAGDAALAELAKKLGVGRG